MKYIHKATTVDAFHYVSREDTPRVVEFLASRGHVEAHSRPEALLIQTPGGNFVLDPGAFLFVRETGYVDILPENLFLARYEPASKVKK